MNRIASCRTLASLIVASLALVACENKSGGPPAPSASAAASTAATSLASAAPSASAAPASSAAASSAWSGTYKSAAGALAIPPVPAFKDVTWKGDDGGAGIGDGQLTLAVDGDGHVTGTGAGALGPFVVEGVLKDGAFTASITRKDPSDHGLIGTAVGKVAGDKLEGTMTLSSPDAVVLRKATFSVAKKQ